ncbi:metallophosphoesterase [Helicobacter anseris]|uniref:Metallophosphoesterase n=1 Tax=Helicobacter anseris TaxID=375926 RepID=A0A3D8J9Y8_9HELI|nr:metallophosphoesterase [Helicobacter anseris]
MQNSHHFLFYCFIFFALCLSHALIYYTFFYKIKFFTKKNIFAFLTILFLSNLSYFTLHNMIHLPYGIDFFLALMLGVNFLLCIGAVLYYCSILPLALFGSKSQYYSFVPYAKTITISFVIIGIFYGFYNGFFKEPKLQRISLNISNLSQELKVLQISDLHINTLTRMQTLKQIIQISNRANPDIIVLTGDIIDAKSHFIEEKINLLKNLKAKYGVYYVLGNHEYLYDIDTILNKLKENHITILNNTSSIITINNKPVINIIGITDFFGNQVNYLKPNIKQAILKGMPKIPNLLLSHQPKVIYFLDNSSKIDLVLSGHTHGGQIFPFNFLVLLEQPYIKGLHEFKPQEYIYINQGTGTWGAPIRVGTNSEITLITLQPK